MKEKNIYIGCGPDTREGFIHVDIRDLDNVDIVCNAWELSKHIQDVDHIYSRHMLEHLTNFEADRTLRDWLKSLKTNGKIEIILFILQKIVVLAACTGILEKCLVLKIYPMLFSIKLISSMKY